MYLEPWMTFDANAFPIEPTGRHIPCVDRGFYIEDICTFQEGDERRIILVQTSCDPFGKCVFCYVGSRSADLLGRKSKPNILSIVER